MTLVPASSRPSGGGSITLPATISGAGGLTIDSSDPASLALSIESADPASDGANALVIENGDGDYVLQVATDGTLLIQGRAGAGGISFRDDALNDVLNVRPNSLAIGKAGVQIGFFGHMNAAQPVVPLTTPSVQDVVDALVALGLVAQHD